TTFWHMAQVALALLPEPGFPVVGATSARPASPSAGPVREADSDLLPGEGPGTGLGRPRAAHRALPSPPRARVRGATAGEPGRGLRRPGGAVKRLSRDRSR